MLAVSLRRHCSLKILILKRTKETEFKVTLTVEFAMSLVGVLTFFLWKIKNLMTMAKK